jgi:oligopeptide transport system substrate-binding protein
VARGEYRQVYDAQKKKWEYDLAIYLSQKEKTMRKNLVVIFSLVIVASMLLTSCATAAEPETIIQTVVVDGEVKEIVVTATPDPDAIKAEPKVLTLELGPNDIPTLDPALASDNASLQIIEETFIGLTRLDEESIEVVPGMAEEWELSEDGRTITFKLRDDVPWVRYDSLAGEAVAVLDCEGNARMVNANDFYYGIVRTLTPATASDYAYVLSFAIEGAAAFNNGETDDPSTIGVEVINDYTIAITFIQDAAYNLNIAGMWIADAMPSWLIEGDDCTEARGDRWTETGFQQSYGPFVMKEWVHDAFITLVPNNLWVETEEIPMPVIDEVTWYFLDNTAAFAEYEAGNMDVTRVPLADIDRVKVDPVYSQELHIAPQLSTYYYGFNTEAEHVSDIRVRRALSMAVDRQSLVDNVTKGGQEPAQWFCRPGLVACPTMESHPDLGVKYDPETARALLQEYMDENGLTIEDVDITLMFNTGSGNQKIAEAIQGMWHEVLGLNVNLTNQEWKVFLKTTKSPDAPQVYRSGWNLDYPDANNFTFEVTASGGNDNPVDADGVKGGLHWYNEEFEQLVRLAAAERDPEQRIEYYAQAEQILAYEDAAIIPIYWYTQVNVTKPHVVRTYSNTGSQHIEKWDIVR